MDIQFKGMTVNERLFVSGQMDDFDRLVKTKNIDGIIALLETVEVTDEAAIRSIIDALGF